MISSQCTSSPHRLVDQSLVATVAAFIKVWLAGFCACIASSLSTECYYLLLSRQMIILIIMEPPTSGSGIEPERDAEMSQ